MLLKNVTTISIDLCFFFFCTGNFSKMKSIIALVCLLQCAAGFKFSLTARDYKCFHEELPHDYEFAGTWKASAGYSQFIDIKITNPDGNVIFEEKAKDESEFFIHTTHSGDHTVCFYNRLAAGVPFAPNMMREVTVCTFFFIFFL